MHFRELIFVAFQLILCLSAALVLQVICSSLIYVSQNPRAKVARTAIKQANHWLHLLYVWVLLEIYAC